MPAQPILVQPKLKLRLPHNDPVNSVCSKGALQLFLKAYTTNCSMTNQKTGKFKFRKHVSPPAIAFLPFSWCSSPGTEASLSLRAPTSLLIGLPQFLLPHSSPAQHWFWHVFCTTQIQSLCILCNQTNSCPGHRFSAAVRGRGALQQFKLWLLLTVKEWEQVNRSGPAETDTNPNHDCDELLIIVFPDQLTPEFCLCSDTGPLLLKDCFSF